MPRAICRTAGPVRRDRFPPSILPRAARRIRPTHPYGTAGAAGGTAGARRRATPVRGPGDHPGGQPTAHPGRGLGDGNGAAAAEGGPGRGEAAGAGAPDRPGPATHGPGGGPTPPGPVRHPRGLWQRNSPARRTPPSRLAVARADPRVHMQPPAAVPAQSAQAGARPHIPGARSRPLSGAPRAPSPNPREPPAEPPPVVRGRFDGAARKIG
jgi:hypothetical protein